MPINAEARMRFTRGFNRIGFSLALCLGLGACLNVPELGEQNLGALKDADYPELKPLAPLLGAPSDPAAQSQALSDDLIRRQAALETKAARLKGEILTSQDQERLKQGVTE